MFKCHFAKWLSFTFSKHNLAIQLGMQNPLSFVPKYITILTTIDGGMMSLANNLTRQHMNMHHVF